MAALEHHPLQWMIAMFFELAHNQFSICLHMEHNLSRGGES
jgi:hypothetical protein